MKADIGVIGLAVMGQNLILNMNDHGFVVSAFNRSRGKTDVFLAGAANGTRVIPTYSLTELVASLAKPRKVLLMVRAGEAVDQLIAQLVPLLETGDVLIDGGNANYQDTQRRAELLKANGIGFLGMGISGGEEGARHGPSVMAGGDRAAWEIVKPVFQAVAAKTTTGESCAGFIGGGGSGHFVKMIHNGIEYGDMQLIAETYDFMKSALGLSYEQMSAQFARWNHTELDSYLIEITADILAYKDDDGQPLVEKILDCAGQKGTGKWTGMKALELGAPLTLITEAVFARCVSALKVQRIEAAEQFAAKRQLLVGDVEIWLEDLRQALLAAKIISYAQGFMLLREASQIYQWDLQFGDIALLWREGCIIRSTFLEDIRKAYRDEPVIEFLGSAPYFQQLLKACLPSWRRIVAKAVEMDLPVPCLASALMFLNSYTQAKSPANLLQAQRDYFGAHTYERVDQPRKAYFHTRWTQNSGSVASGSYKV